MSVEKRVRVRSVRTSEEEDSIWERIQTGLFPLVSNFSETVNLCGRLVWRWLSMPGMLADVVQVCQQLRCITSYDTEPDTRSEQVTEQMRLPFVPHDGYSFLPKFPPRRAADDAGVRQNSGRSMARPRFSVNRAVGAELEMGAWHPPFLGNFRRMFVSEVSTRRVA